ncbi:MerR family transcriptional regulator [Tsuneonella sp. SYSU-LHT278]|uniref:MerR family transcriptional regulator n=1 Tax=Tsuneonella sediminis TaxID=3416089 RepID=UPI003F78F7CF
MTSGFDDGKDEGALRTIGEVGEALGIKAHVLRYWEGQFPQLRPMKRSGGRRYYRPEDVALVKEIDKLVNREGYTLRGAKAALAANPGPDATNATASSTADRASVPAEGIRSDALDRLRAIRRTLADALET